MRVSVREDDPGYLPGVYLVEVFIDSAPVSHCFTADEEKGIAYCYALDGKGRPYADPEKLGCLKETQYCGRVEIKFSNAPTLVKEMLVARRLESALLA